MNLTTNNATANEARQVIKRAKDFYRKAQSEIESKHRGAYISINAITGEYVFADTILEVVKLFDRQFGSKTPSWVTQVGNKGHVRLGAGHL